MEWMVNSMTFTVLSIEEDLDFGCEERPDGAVTVWVNERERMFHQQGRGGFTLRPGCAYLEIQGVLDYADGTQGGVFCPVGAFGGAAADGVCPGRPR